MKINEEQIFTLTNPLFWIWAIILFTIKFFNRVIEYSGLADWFFILFRFKEISKEGQNFIVFIDSKNDYSRGSWLKRKAWSYAAKKIKENN